MNLLPGSRRYGYICVALLRSVKLENSPSTDRHRQLMDTNDSLPEKSAATVAFEQDLNALLLEAFANGAAVEGEWKINLPVEAAPDWTIQITKRRSEKHSVDDLEFIEE